MIFTPTPIDGLWVIDPEPIKDQRGWFARVYDQDEFAKRGLNTDWAQWSASFTEKPGTVRGMHFQKAPHGEVKLVTCQQGAIHDVVIDLRAGSSSFRRSFAVTLDGASGRQLYIPEGLAHGFQTLAANSAVGYHISCRYEPQSASGLRWNDPAVDIVWPLPISEIADKDLAWPDFKGPS